jgi:hypothetical protein
MSTETTGDLKLIKPETTDNIVQTIGTDLPANFDKIDTEVTKKVDKVTGKGLSTNDYTTGEKNKLAGIAAEANKTVIADNLTTDDATKALSAKQGKALKDELSEHKSAYVEEVGTVANLTTTSKEVVGAINELNTNKANKQQEEWITPTLLNGATGDLQYRMNIFGRVEFRGELIAPLQNNAFVLPIKYRPLSTVLGIIPERPTGITSRRVAMLNNNTGFYVYGSSENAMSLCSFSYVGRGE